MTLTNLEKNTSNYDKFTSCYKYENLRKIKTEHNTSELKERGCSVPRCSDTHGRLLFFLGTCTGSPSFEPKASVDVTYHTQGSDPRVDLDG